MDTDDLKPWGQVAGESAKAYHAFIAHFVSLPMWKRSMAAAFTDHLIRCKHQSHTKSVHCNQEWNDWRFRYSWLERAAAYDAAQIEKDRLLKLHEIEEMNQRHIALSTGLQDTVVSRLTALMMDPSKAEAMSAVQMAHVLDRASVIERRARDVATSITKTEGAQGVSLDLTKLSEAELAVFEKLVAKAEPGAKVELSKESLGKGST